MDLAERLATKVDPAENEPDKWYSEHLFAEFEKKLGLVEKKKRGPLDSSLMAGLVDQLRNSPEEINGAIDDDAQKQAMRALLQALKRRNDEGGITSAVEEYVRKRRGGKCGVPEMMDVLATEGRVPKAELTGKRKPQLVERLYKLASQATEETEVVGHREQPLITDFVDAQSRAQSEVQALERARREARARPDGLVPADDPEDEENFYFPAEDTSGSSEEEDMDVAPQVAVAAAATPSDPAPRRGSRARARSRLGIALDVASLAKRCRSYNAGGSASESK